MKTAAELGLAGCHVCGSLSPVARPRCARCGESLHQRKPDSLNRSWAYLLAALALFLPANLLPVMTMISLGNALPSTILSGVLLLLHEGMWPLALLIFVASIVVPVLKILIMAGLLLSVHWGFPRRAAERTRLYRITEFIGRWSMVDIFVVTILAGLVQLGEVVRIEGGAGATLFGAVVVLTMLAAEAFDPRLIWDSVGQGDD